MYTYVKLSTLACLVFLVFTVSVVTAQEEEKKSSSIPEFSRRHQGGVRIGAWVNLGDKPPASYSNDAYLTTTNINNANMYGEAFVAFRLIPHIMLELAIGVVNRGTITTYDSTTGEDRVGNLYINPVLTQFRIYPFASVNSKIQPWISGGGGMYFGRRSIQFIDLGESYGDYYGDFTEDNQTKFNYTLGGGFDWILGKSIALEASGRYMPLSFDEGLALIDSYDALSITVGIKYVFEIKKDSHSGGRR